jgi:hypothetical protein
MRCTSLRDRPFVGCLIYFREQCGNCFSTCSDVLSDTRQAAAWKRFVCWRNTQGAASNGGSADEDVVVVAIAPPPAATPPAAPAPMAAVKRFPAAITSQLPADAAGLVDLEDIDEAYLWCVSGTFSPTVPGTCTLLFLFSCEPYAQPLGQYDPDTDKAFLSACSPITQARMPFHNVHDMSWLLCCTSISPDDAVQRVRSASLCCCRS